ncbi:MAG: DNA polymerase IV [Clostridia bacterium]|nr:DNA polymerase IV [Clostridia bacterium]
MADFILHSDLNCFYVSAEINEEPSLRGKCVAVCGSTENRHGIVLAKSYEAKAMGVKTGQVNHEALKACPQLIMIEPHYELYLHYSRLVRQIYTRYSRFIEPFGMDECWILLPNLDDISKAEAIAQEIRRTVKQEIGLTVSIGVSFSKVFAKLGSDMKKPDAVSVISRENYRSLVWPLPVGEILYAGPHTVKKLADVGVYTIGELARFPEALIRAKLGKNGVELRRFARGEDGARVAESGYSQPVKSIGHGATCVRDLHANEEVWRVMYELSQDVSHRLRKHAFLACGVSLGIRYSDLENVIFQRPLRVPTRSALDIAAGAFELYRAHHEAGRPVRALTVCAGKLSPDGAPAQCDIFGDSMRVQKRRTLDDAVDDLRGRFGVSCLRAASLLYGTPIATDRCETVPMPALMYR